jgi:hypothetical protein
MPEIKSHSKLFFVKSCRLAAYPGGNHAGTPGKEKIVSRPGNNPAQTEVGEPTCHRGQ